MISDHFHPWVGQQAHSPFTWTVVGGIANATRKLPLGTGITCPLVRYHPVIVAQAAATAAMMMPGRFFLGVGTGEILNEHITGEHWPSYNVRLEMLEEAVAIIRLLWRGGLRSYRGRYYTVEEAQIYSLPQTLPPIMVAAEGKESAETAGRLGDGFIGTTPEKELLQAFERSGGKGKPRHGKLTVCWARSEQEARRTAFKWWPNGALQGQLSTELRLPRFYEQALAFAGENDVAEKVVCGPDPELHVAKIKTYADAGYDYIHIHQVGPDQIGFFDFYKREIFPRLERVGVSVS
jgi:G6PDH family F420-dependent oxidoreductase